MSEKVLIVDDQFGIRMLLSEILKKEGYTTYQAANGFQALEIVTEQEIDLAILDMKMPGMNGIELLKKIREQDDSVKVMFVTAFGELSAIEEAKRDYGVTSYLAKPFKIDEMKGEVRHVLGKSSPPSLVL